jgi:hypothetical protein
MWMCVCYLDCHKVGLCGYLVIHIETLWRSLQLFYFHLWSIYWLSLEFPWLTVKRSQVMEIQSLSVPESNMRWFLISIPCTVRAYTYRVPSDPCPPQRPVLVSPSLSSKTTVNITWYDAMTGVAIKSYIFWNIMLSRPLNFYRRFGGMLSPPSDSKNTSREKPAWSRQQTEFFFMLKIQAACSSETSVRCQRTTLHYITGYGTLKYYRHQFTKSDKTGHYHISIFRQYQHCCGKVYMCTALSWNWLVLMLFNEAASTIDLT